MAYDPENPPSLMVQNIGGTVGLRHYALMWTDPIATVLTPGYISNAEEIGMRAGDVFQYSDVNMGQWSSYFLICTAIAANGSATLEFPEVPEEALPFVEVLDPGAGDVYAVAFQGGRQIRTPVEQAASAILAIPTQAEAEAGLVNTGRMTPLRTAQAIAALAGTTFTGIGVFIAGLTSKATPVDADDLIISDSAAADVQKRLTWANVKATLKTYFDTLYLGVVGVTVDNTIVRFNGTAGQQQGSLVTVDDLGRINAGDGTVALPAYGFSSETNVGFWKTANTNRVGFAVGGVNSIRFQDNGLNVCAEATGTSALVFGTDQAIKLISLPATGGHQIDITNGMGGGALRLSRGVASDGQVASFYRQTVEVGSITVTSTTTGYNTSSDYRLPWKVGAVPVEDSGAFIDALRPMYFPEVGFAGFIADQFAEVSPSSVSGEKDAVNEDGEPVYQSMESSSPDVMANLIAEIQSLRKRLAAAGL